MYRASLDNILWAVGWSGEIALLAVLTRTGRWKRFPMFSLLLLSNATASPALFAATHLGAVAWYVRIYWTYAILNFALQLALVLEIARAVLRPTGTWVRDARGTFIAFGLAGALLAAVLAYMVAPPAPGTFGSLELKANLFTSLLICELFIAISLAANKLGLGWKNHAIAIVQGLMCWSTIAVIIDSLHSYFGTGRFYAEAEYLKVFAYLGALTYWCVQLWREEPAPRPISPELRQYIVALHRRVQYDLGEAEQ